MYYFCFLGNILNFLFVSIQCHLNCFICSKIFLILIIFYLPVFLDLFYLFSIYISSYNIFLYMHFCQVQSPIFSNHILGKLRTMLSSSNTEIFIILKTTRRSHLYSNLSLIFNINSIYFLHL